MTIGAYLESLGMLAKAACMYADEVKRGVPQYIEAAEKTLHLLAIEFAKKESSMSAPRHLEHQSEDEKSLEPLA